MNEEKIKPIIKKLIYTVVVVLLIPIIIFIVNFYKHSISDSISDWGAFGDFFGGILNTTISFLSLIILAFLTYFVSKQSDLETKKTNILIRKLDAYNELTDFLPSIRHSLFLITVRVKALTNHLDNVKNLYDVEYLRKNERAIEPLNEFVKFYYYISSFKLKFGHLYTYNFDSQDFEELISSSKETSDYFKSIIKKFEMNEGQFIEAPDFDIYLKNVYNFVESLKSELK